MTQPKQDNTENEEVKRLAFSMNSMSHWENWILIKILLKHDEAFLHPKHPIVHSPRLVDDSDLRNPFTFCLPKWEHFLPQMKCLLIANYPISQCKWVAKWEEENVFYVLKHLFLISLISISRPHIRESRNFVANCFES